MFDAPDDGGRFSLVHRYFGIDENLVGGSGRRGTFKNKVLAFKFVEAFGPGFDVELTINFDKFVLLALRGLPPIASEHELADELEIKRFVEKFFKAFVLFALRNVGIDDFLNSFLGDFLDKALGFAGVDGGANRERR